MARRSHHARRSSGWLGSLAVLLVTLAVGAVGLELGLRAYFFGDLKTPRFGSDFFQSHPTRGWANKPSFRGLHQELDFRVRVTTNSHGLRGPEFAAQPDGRRQRIMVVADSSMFGSGARDDETLPAQLQKILGADAVEVINLSVTAYSTVQEHMMLVEEGLAWRPDLVLLAFSPGNDIQTNTVELQRLFQRTLRRPYASLDAAGKISIDTAAAAAGERRADAPSRGFFANLVLVRVGATLWRKFAGGQKVDPNIFLGWPYLVDFVPQHGLDGRTRADYERLWGEGWRVTSALIADMAERSKAAGARFAVFSTTSKAQADPAQRARLEQAFPGARIDPGKMDRELAKLAAAIGVPALDITAAIVAEAAKGGEPLYFAFEDEHWTPRGNRFAAETLAARLREAGLLRK